MDKMELDELFKQFNMPKAQAAYNEMQFVLLVERMREVVEKQGILLQALVRKLSRIEEILERHTQALNELKNATTRS